METARELSHTLSVSPTFFLTSGTVPTLLLIPIFFTVESTRAALWTARALEEPDRDGPLLRALFAFLVRVLSVVPSPVWALLTCIAWVAWIPVRGILWVWGFGRGGVKKRECVVTPPALQLVTSGDAGGVWSRLFPMPIEPVY